MSFIFSLLWAWIKDSQFHKTAASAAAGTSVGMLTVLGILEQKIDTVKAEVKSDIVIIKEDVREIDLFVKHRKEITDERFGDLNKRLDYLIRGIDGVKQDILHLSQDVKRSR